MTAEACEPVGWAYQRVGVLDPVLAVRMAGDPIAVLPSMFHMLWSGTLDADLSAGPLGGRTLVRMRTVR